MRTQSKQQNRKENERITEIICKILSKKNVESHKVRLVRANLALVAGSDYMFEQAIMNLEKEYPWLREELL